MPLPVGFELEEKKEPGVPEGFELEPSTLEPSPRVPEGFELEVTKRKLPNPSLPSYLNYKLMADKASSARSTWGRVLQT